MTLIKPTNLQSVISKIRKTTNNILREELEDKIKETDLKIWTNSEFKVIQVRNCTEKTKIKPARPDNLPQTPHKASAKDQNHTIVTLYISQSIESKISSQIVITKVRNRQVNHLLAVVPNQNPYHTSHHLCILNIFHLKDVKHQNSMSCQLSKATRKSTTN